MDEIEIFKELGLSKNEGKVYSELVKHGKLPAAEISSKAEVPYGKIYVVLQGLIDKGLVRVIPDKTKKFASASPDFLIKLVEEKEKLLEEVKNKARAMKQIYEEKEKDILIVGEGDKGFWKIADEMKEVEKYGYNIRWDSKIRPGAFERTRKKLKKGIEMKDLVRYDDETKSNVKKWLKVKPNIRQFPNEGAVIGVLDDREVLIGLIKKNTTLLIRDEAFAKIVKRLFLAAYDKADKINQKS